MALVVEILAGGGFGIIVIRVDGAGVVGDVRGIVRFFGGLLLVLLKFVHPADDRADLGAGDVPLGVEVGFAVAFCGALEDAVVGEDEGGHVAGVGEGEAVCCFRSTPRTFTMSSAICRRFMASFRPRLQLLLRKPFSWASW